MTGSPQVVVFGERPGPNTDPERALFPHSTTGAAAKLIRLMGVSQPDYLAGTQRYNAFHDGQRLLSLNEAREWVQAKMTLALAEHQNPRFVFVGAEPLRAAPQFYRRMEFLETKDTVLYLPHTSGVNRWYNAVSNVAAAAAATRAHLAGYLRRSEPHTAPPAAGGSAAPGGALLPLDEPLLGPAEWEYLFQGWQERTCIHSSTSIIMEDPSVPLLQAEGWHTADRLTRKLYLDPAHFGVGELMMLARIAPGWFPPPEDGPMQRLDVRGCGELWLQWYGERVRARPL